ncbi:MAG TPA: ParB/RepB/Spo0J family partition protein [Steroidobacteraceae bacterium]|nr:ParB/RepB/Spo0J family partition protein [Steroidobacteraceae bacterium]
MNQKRPTLGRGLADLLGQTRPPPPAGASAGQAPALSRRDIDEQLMRLPLDLLQRGRYQPRLDMRAESLTELADSIRAQGVVQPIVVRTVGEPDERGIQRYEIIAGERRWRAAQQAGLRDIPAVIRRVPDEAVIAMALIENIQREDLNPLEEAHALERLISEFGLTHQQAADAVGRSRAAVSNLLRLLELPEEVCERLAKRELEMGHARALLGLPQRRQQIEVATLVVRKSLSVRETEALVRRMSQPQRTPADAPPAAVDPNIRRLQDDLSDKLGAAVAIEHAPSGKGRLLIKYNSLDELDGILTHIV